MEGQNGMRKRATMIFIPLVALKQRTESRRERNVISRFIPRLISDILISFTDFVWGKTREEKM